MTAGPQSVADDDEAGWLRERSKSVVKLRVTQQPWDPYQPWDRQYAEEIIGSGFFLGEHILTNAHVVADASFIEMEVPGWRRRIEGRIVAVNHQVDLALVEPLTEDESELDYEGFALGDLPVHLDRVTTVGYPIGGREVSYTAGIVSRVDVLPYAHSHIKGLLVQTDAAINPGNSGGPVLSSRTRECVGVASQGFQNGEGLGYFIPTPIIRQFLTDGEGGEPRGISNLGCRLQALHNPAHRSFLGAPKSQGVRVTQVFRGSSADGIVHSEDVILSLDGRKVSPDGRVPLGAHGTVSLSFALADKQVGDVVALVVLRDRKELELTLTLKPFCSTVISPLPRYDRQPAYHVEGGLVFLAVDQRYSAWLDDDDGLPDSVSMYRWLPLGHENLDELVVVARVLPATINKGYSGRVENSRVTMVNRDVVTSLASLTAALERGRKQEFIRISLESKREIVFRSAELDAANKKIRRKYRLDYGS